MLPIEKEASCRHRLRSGALPCRSFRVIGLLLMASCGWAQYAPSAAKAKPLPHPQIIVYQYLFHQVTAFEKQSNQRYAQGLFGDPFEHHFRRKLNLGTEEEADLKQIAQAYATEIAPIRAQLAAKRQAFQAQYPLGLTTKDKLPPAPPDLTAEREQKAQILEHHVTQLQTAWGVDRFQEVDRTVQAVLAPNLRVLTPNAQPKESK